MVFKFQHLLIQEHIAYYLTIFKSQNCHLYYFIYSYDILIKAKTQKLNLSGFSSKIIANFSDPDQSINVTKAKIKSFFYTTDLYL